MKGKIGFNRLPDVAAAVPRAGNLIVEKIVQDIAAGAGATAPIDTGALAGSYFAEASGTSDIAGSNIEYAPYVEFGTVHSGAQPHLVPSADRVANALGSANIKIVANTIERAAKGGH